MHAAVGAPSSSAAALFADAAAAHASSAGDGGGGGDDSAAAASSEQPVGWVAARGVDAAEARRLLAALAPYAMDGSTLKGGGAGKKKGGQQQHAQAADDGDVEMYVPSASLHVALRAALPSSEDSSLLSSAPSPPKGTRAVPLGTLVLWWFECVWPQTLAGGGGGPKPSGAELLDEGGAPDAAEPQPLHGEPVEVA